MKLRLGSASLDDAAFLAAVEGCTYPLEAFGHGDHLRLGWLLLADADVSAAVDQATRILRRFIRHHGKEEHYHETITRGWMLLLASHDEHDFEEFLTCHHARLSPTLLHRHWRPETLQSAVARQSWVNPDLLPLPAAVPRCSRSSTARFDP